MGHDNNSESRRLGDSELVCEIGRGGMGAVYPKAASYSRLFRCTT